MTVSDDESLAALAEDDPEEMIRLIARLADDEHFGANELVGMAKDCAADGVNLFRVLADHPKLTTAELGVDVSRVESLAETFDAAIDGD